MERTKNQRHGGVAVYIKLCLEVKVRDDLCVYVEMVLENLVIKVVLAN